MNIRHLGWGLLFGLGLAAFGGVLAEEKKKDKAAMTGDGKTEKAAASLPKTAEEWKKILTPEQFRVTQQKGTEKPFTGEYWDCKRDGTYHCVCCGAPLFTSETKFDSGCGWPSFFQPVGKETIKSAADYSHFMTRVEVMCKNCGAHLGHVFDDGPKPTGQRYCINSASLKLKAANKADPAKKEPGKEAK